MAMQVTATWGINYFVQQHHCTSTLHASSRRAPTAQNNRGMRAPTWERQHPGPARLNRHGPHAVCRAAAAFIETHGTGLQLSARALRLSAPPLASVPLCPGKSARALEEGAHCPGVAVATTVAAATAALLLLPAPPSIRRRCLHRPAAVAASATLCPGEGARAPEERTRS